MKSSPIEFIPSKAWIGIWCTAMVCFLSLIALFAPKALRHHQKYRLTEQKIVEFKQNRTVDKSVLVKLPSDRLNHSQQAAVLLQTDLNSVFTLIEKTKEANVRLRSLSIDSPSQAVRLDFELDSMVRAASVTTSLNAGYNEGPWRLEAVNPSALTNQAATKTSARAVWGAELGKL